MRHGAGLRRDARRTAHRRDRPTRRRRAFSRPSRSAATATAVPFSRMTTAWPICSAPSAITGRAETGMKTSGSVSIPGWTRSRRQSCSRSSRSSPTNRAPGGGRASLQRGAVAIEPYPRAPVIAGAQSTWAQYTIQVPDRDKLQSDLKARGVPTAVYYPIPLSKQSGYSAYPSAPTARERADLRNGREPADASLSRRGDSGSDRRPPCSKRSLARCVLVAVFGARHARQHGVGILPVPGHDGGHFPSAACEPPSSRDWRSSPTRSHSAGR